MPSKISKPKEVKSKTLVKKPVVKKEDVKNVSVTNEEKTSKGSISVNLYSIDGKVSGKIGLPKEIFGAKINPTLMAQAVRVFLFSQRRGTASSKTRGEVAGTTKKIYRQKGTGRARHGAAKAPIFVGGGITFGPKPRDFSLELPKKMKRGALFSALSAKAKEGKILVIDSEELSGKTKEMSAFLKNIDLLNKKVTIVTSKDSANAERASKNLENALVIRAENLNTYSVLRNENILFVKSSLDVIKDTFLKVK